MTAWPYLRTTDWLLIIGDGSILFKRYWSRIFNAAYGGCIDTWDDHWTFSCWSQNGLTILPARNLVTNIGFGKHATHTSKGNQTVAELPLESLEFPLVHPSTMVRDVGADRWEARYVFGINWLSEILIHVKKLSIGSFIIKYLKKFREKL